VGGVISVATAQAAALGRLALAPWRALGWRLGTDHPTGAARRDPRQGIGRGLRPSAKYLLTGGIARCGNLWIGTRRTSISLAPFLVRLTSI